jgi:hypothetical protein
MTLEHVCYIRIYYFYIYVIFGIFPSSLAFKYVKQKFVAVRREAARREGMFVSGSTAARILNIGILWRVITFTLRPLCSLGKIVILTLVPIICNTSGY